MSQPQTQLPFVTPTPQYAAASQPKLVHQIFGTVVAVIFALLMLKAIFFRLYAAYLQTILPLLSLNQVLHLISAAVRLYFFVQMIRVPEFLAGNPNLKKFSPLFVSLFIDMTRIFMLTFIAEIPPWIEYNPIRDSFVEIGFLLLCLALYYHDDSKQGCCLCFKPWVYKEIDQFTYIPDKIVTPNSNQLSYNYPTRSQPYPGYNQPIQPQV